MTLRNACLLLCATLLATNLTVTAQRSESSQPEPASFLGYLPLAFEPNSGQAPPDVLFLSRTGKYTLLLDANEALLVLPPANSEPERGSRQPLSLKLVGGQSTTSIEGMDRLPGRSNYFIGNDPAKWRTNIPQYARVEYKSVYSGIDLVFYGHEGNLEYDFQVAAGADPNLINLLIDGADQIGVDGSGNLLLHVDHEIIWLKKPYVYQAAKGGRREVACNFVLHGNDVGFKLDKYDARLPLVIDPVLSYGVLISANNDTQAQGMAIDSFGDMYIIGTTFATNYPTVSAFQPTNHGTRTLSLRN